MRDINEQRPGQSRTGAPRAHSEELQSNYTGSPAGNLITRLATVRDTGPGEWIASCPGPLHDRGDRNPSLSIKEESDGRLLVCCFAGCSADDILAALGLELRDLYPAPLSNYKTPLSRIQRRRNGQAVDALKAIRQEALLVHVAARMLRQGETLDDEAMDRLAQAECRIKKAVEVVS